MSSKILRWVMRHPAPLQTIGIGVLGIASFLEAFFIVVFIGMCFVEGITAAWLSVTNSPTLPNFVMLFFVVAALWLGTATGLVSSDDFKPTVECDRPHADEPKEEQPL